MKKLFILPAFLFHAFPAVTQNLIPNSNFETYNICPSNQGQTFRAVPWFDPAANLGSGSDYYNICAPIASSVNVPNGGNGYQQPNSGNGFCGLYLYHASIVDSREYISVQTTSSLAAGQCYFFSMYMNLSNNSRYTTEAIQVYFSATATTSLPMPGIMNVTPQLFHTPGNLPDSATWILMSGTYIATGGEQYVTIGNFLPDSAITLVQVLTAGSGRCYLNVDDVSLSLCTGTAEPTVPLALTLYPEYQSQTIIIKVNRPGKYYLRLYDVAGRTLYYSEISSETSLHASQFSKGIIFYSVSEGGRVINNGKIFWE